MNQIKPNQTKAMQQFAFSDQQNDENDDAVGTLVIYTEKSDNEMR